MRIRLSDRRLVHDLLGFLREVPGCIAVQASGDTVEALLPGARSEQEADEKLRGYVRTWQTTYPEVRVHLATSSALGAPRST